MTPLPITISILTWKSPKTLQRTLQSLAPIKDFFAERLVICQESDPEEIAISETYGFTPVKLKENVGIQNGLVECVRRARHEHTLILENDIPWIESPDRAFDFYSDCEHFLKSGLKLCRLDKFEEAARKRFSRFWGGTFPVTRTFLGLIRPFEANSIRAEIVGLKGFRHDSSMNSFLKKHTETFYITNSSAVFYNGHALLVNREFFLSNIIAYAESARPRRSFNQSPELESTLNCPRNRRWWRSKKFPIGISAPGYFGHLRYDRHELDEKALSGGGLEAD